jgi:hypothetical protein
VRLRTFSFRIACAIASIALFQGCASQGRRLDAGSWATSGIPSDVGCIRIEHPALIPGLDTFELMSSFDHTAGEENSIGGGNWKYVSNPWRADCCPGISVSLRKRSISPFMGDPLTALQAALVAEQEARVASLAPDHVTLGDPNSRSFQRMPIAGRDWLVASRYSWGTLRFTHVDGPHFLEVKPRLNEAYNLKPSAKTDATAALDRILMSIRIEPLAERSSCTVSGNGR